MKYPQPLQQARLIKRYKRFLADIELPDGSQITIHCPNTGSMKNCQDDQARVWYSDSCNEKRKYRHTWELVEVEGQYLACVNTGLPNKLAKEAIELKNIPELADFDELKTEVKYGENSRIDILLTKGEQKTYVEVKSVTLLEDSNLNGENQGYFPDSVSDRASKHLRELMGMVEQGHRAVLFFCVSHTGINQVSPADHIDKKYGQYIRQALKAGVEILAYRAEITQEEIFLQDKIPVVITD